MFKRNRHRTSRRAREAEEAATLRRTSLLDMLGTRQNEMAGVDALARKQVGLDGGVFMPSGSYNPQEAEAKARARGLRAVSQARIDEIKRQLGEPV